jgi:hypothetical protein
VHYESAALTAELQARSRECVYEFSIGARPRRQWRHDWGANLAGAEGRREDDYPYETAARFQARDSESENTLN